MKTHQSELTFLDNEVIKKYKDSRINRMSSLNNELHSLEKFSCSGKNCHSPLIKKLSENSYSIERYDFSLGNTKTTSKEKVRRLLFTISMLEVLKQFEEIEKKLKELKIEHRDVNPGNLLFSERERTVKLIDFYWAKTDNLKVGTPEGLNGIYGVDDSKAFRRIKMELNLVNKKVLKQVKNLKTRTSTFGKKYYDGSAKKRGKTYHVVDIPYLKTIRFHRNIESEYRDVIQYLSNPPKTVIDIGCAGGYYLFNLMRQFRLNKAIGFEADPNMFDFLNVLRVMFSLDELVLKEKVTAETIFEPVDLVICMNIHMWLVKQLKEGADQVIINLIKNSKELFFQTAGKESNGMYKVGKLTSKEVIRDYLKRLGDNKEVTYIRTTNQHGGKRHLFKIE